MSRTATTTIRVEWGDCDPAGIVYYPNFFTGATPTWLSQLA